MTIRITGPKPGDTATCDKILRSLPQWFGIEKAIRHYSRAITKMPTFSANDRGRTIGFLSVKRHFRYAAEIYVMAIEPECRGRGVGKALLKRTEHWLRQHGYRILQVKTLSASRRNAHYAATRAFYMKTGFIPLEEIPELWSKENPCLVLVKALNGRRHLIPVMFRGAPTEARFRCHEK